MVEKSNPPTTFHQLNHHTGEIELVDMMTGATLSLSRLQEYDKHKYSLAMSEVICEYVRKGFTLTKIANMTGMPSASVIFRWKQLHPDFGEKIKAAKLDRAEYFHDQVLDVIDNVEKVEDKDRAALASLKIAGYKWLAEVGDPNQYGKKTKITGDASQPLQFIIKTGIDEERSHPELTHDLAREQSAIAAQAGDFVPLPESHHDIEE